MSIPVETTFIEWQHLGVLEQQLKLMYEQKSKQKRVAIRNRVVRVLKDLGLAETGRDIFYVGLGVTALGTPGLMIVYSIGSRTEAQVPSEGPY